MSTKQHKITEATYDAKWKSTRITMECGHTSLLRGKLTTDDTWACNSGCVDSIWSKNTDGTWEMTPATRARFVPITCGCYGYQKCNCGIMGTIDIPHAEHASTCPIASLPDEVLPDPVFPHE